jgi:hypothetical protein
MLAILAIYRIIFPSGYFVYSFANINSLKNTITDTTLSEKMLSFYASTPLRFSQVKINMELLNSDAPLENQTISIQKSYKAFFYPTAQNLEDLNNKEENQLISLDGSVFIIGNNQETPINNPTTFESLGYQWKNVHPNNKDLSIYEKQKLADINSAHPTGTILKTIPDENYYFIENHTKRKIINPPKENIINAIEVNDQSLKEKMNCTLTKSFLSKKKYECVVNLSSVNPLLGKDYNFTLENLPANLKIKQINLEFKKTPSQENFMFFLGDLKQKTFYRFGFKES